MSMFLYRRRVEAMKKKKKKKKSSIKNAIDNIKEKRALSKMNKTQLVSEALKLGLKLDIQLTNKIMIKAIKGKQASIKKKEKEMKKQEKKNG